LGKSDFPRIERLPPYVFNAVNELKVAARKRGEDIIDFGMGNPDQPTPKHIVDKLIEAVQRPDTHRYSLSRGIPRLRRAICNWYQNRYNVELDPELEAIVTIGSKEGLAHLALATVGPGDAVLVPNPTYPIHPYGFVIAGADIRHVPITEESDFFAELEDAIRKSWPKPKLLVLNFPSNPTAQCVDLDFFVRVIEIARAKEIAVECYSLSKSYNMPGWRVGFMCGNQTLISALSRIKSYLDYGMFAPIQIAAITALEGPQQCVGEIRDTYRRRRNVLCAGLNNLGWAVQPPKASMFIWAKIPEQYAHLGSLEFSKKLLLDAQVAVSPGIGFGEFGDDHVRFALIENEHRSRQAIRTVRQMFRRDANGGSGR